MTTDDFIRMADDCLQRASDAEENHKYVDDQLKKAIECLNKARTINGEVAMWQARIARELSTRPS